MGCYFFFICANNSAVDSAHRVQAPFLGALRFEMHWQWRSDICSIGLAVY